MREDFTIESEGKAVAKSPKLNEQSSVISPNAKGNLNNFFQDSINFETVIKDY